MLHQGDGWEMGLGRGWRGSLRWPVGLLMLEWTKKTQRVGISRGYIEGVFGMDWEDAERKSSVGGGGIKNNVEEREERE